MLRVSPWQVVLLVTACASPAAREDPGSSGPEDAAAAQGADTHAAGADGATEAEAAPAVPWTCSAFAATDAGATATCKTNFSYCFVHFSYETWQPDPPQCRPYAEVDECARTPGCACLCAHRYFCQTECRCFESGGRVTVTCAPI